MLTCKTGGGPICSHESISSIWSDCFRRLHIHCRESRSRYTTIDNRPNFVFFDSDIGNNVDLDISLAHPWSSDIFPSSAGVSGAAAERRADRKKEKYSKQLPGSIIATVTPLVMKHLECGGLMDGNSCAKYQRSHRTKWDDQTLWTLSNSGPNAFLFSSRIVMLESSLKTYLRCQKATDVTTLPPRTSATSWYWRLCLYTVAFKCSPHFVLHEFQF